VGGGADEEGAQTAEVRAGIEHVVLDVPKLDGPKPLREVYERWWNSIGPDRADRLILATSHSANYLLDLIERPTRAFTILREPVDRVLSRYYFYPWARTGGRDPDPPGWTLLDLYTNPAKWPDARSWFFNYQSRALLEPHFDVEGEDLAMSEGAPPNADLWRERLRSVLEEHYVVGVQEYFTETVTLFAKEFGWSELLAPRARYNRSRPRDWDDEEVRELILAYNWLDVELYGEYAERMKALSQAP
jgi:hypothetical protein